MHSEYTAADFQRHPLMFYYEVTQACDLVCKHCRASAQEQPRPGRADHRRSPRRLHRPGGHLPPAADAGAHRRRSAQAARPVRAHPPRGRRAAWSRCSPPRPRRWPPARPSRRPERRACGGWASASTAPTPPRTTPSAAGKGASTARWRCWPTPGGWAWRCRSTPPSPAATSARSTPWPSCWPTRASPCGRSSS